MARVSEETVHPPADPPPRRPRRRLLVGILVLVGVAVLVVGLGLFTARAAMLDGAGHLDRAANAARDADLNLAHSDFVAGRTAFDRAHRRLTGPVGVVTAPLPWVGERVQAGRSLARAGGLVAGAGAHLTEVVLDLPGGSSALLPADGVVPVDHLAALREPLAAALDRLDAAARLVDDVRPLDAGQGAADAVALFDQQVAVARPVLQASFDASVAVPPLLGADGPRHYLLAAQNPAELRGTGGLMGAFVLLRADEGRLEFGEFVSVHQLADVPVDRIEPPTAEFAERYNATGGAGFWQNINFSPDFPTVSTALGRLYEQVTGQAVDGVIAVDPLALEHLMRVTGSVEVPPAGTVEADGVVELMANEAYDLFEGDVERKQLMGAIAVRVVERLLGGVDQESLPDVVGALRAAIAGGHLLVHVSDPGVQEALKTLGATGELVAGPGEQVAVVVNNRSAHKGDYYTDRVVHYEVRLQADGSARNTITVTLENHTPTSGLPGHVIGPNIAGMAAGQNRSRVDVFAPEGAELLAFRRSSGQRRLAESSELGRPVFFTLVDVFSGSSAQIQLEWTVPDAWVSDGEGGRYRLTLQDQATIRPTRAVISVAPPPGLRVVGATSGADLRDGSMVWTGEVARVVSLDAVLGP